MGDVTKPQVLVVGRQLEDYDPKSSHGQYRDDPKAQTKEIVNELVSSPIFRQFVRPCASEFVASFIFVACSLLSTTLPTGLYPYATAICRSLIIMALVIIFGHIGGSHVNPSVSLATWISGALSLPLFVFYFVLQLFGSFLGALLCKSLSFSNAYFSAQGGVAVIDRSSTSIGQAILLEICATFLWSLTYLMSHVESNGRSQSTPLALGAVVFIGTTFSTSIIRSCPNNPAQAFGSALAASVYIDQSEANLWDYHFVWWIGPFIGSLLAAFIYRTILADERRRILFKR